MIPIRDANNKRVCDMTDDQKMIVILYRGCITTIRAKDDQPLYVNSEVVPRKALAK